ncbi:hypothetical protein NPIL_477771 [Nephila pilipes]|uniref:Uncharacterized protein n=1 Tax=Nephila pilipes TaxID=299642 RepID=A0A8X6PTW8_NEPPI|nr:hypothetical protein NPIL_477771 [Nephila pilipes]
MFLKKGGGHTPHLDGAKRSAAAIRPSRRVHRSTERLPSTPHFPHPQLDFPADRSSAGLLMSARLLKISSDKSRQWVLRETRTSRSPDVEITKRANSNFFFKRNLTTYGL